LDLGQGGRNGKVLNKTRRPRRTGPEMGKKGLGKADHFLSSGERARDSFGTNLLNPKTEK